MVEASPVPISVAVEGPIDAAVLRRLVEREGATIGTVYGQKGKSALRRDVAGYNNAARFSPWMILADLDCDADCAPLLRAEWLPHPAPRMCLRFAVREVEAWLLADREGVADFLGVSIARIPAQPESIDDPKLEVVNLARRSRRSTIREELAPRPDSGRTVGPLYVSRIIEFALNVWRPEEAMRRADSLRRCSEHLRELIRGQA